MTQEQAQEIKDILLQIRGNIPANLVDPIYNHYKTHINPGFARPCTCQPKYWNQMIVELRDKVEVTLNKVTDENKPELNSTSGEERDGTVDANNSKRKGRKANKTGVA
jgi:hypothetical protein